MQNDRGIRKNFENFCIKRLTEGKLWFIMKKNKKSVSQYIKGKAVKRL